MLVTAAGPGAELLPISRALAGQGELVATDSSPEMIEYARNEAIKAELQMPVEFRVADAADTLGRRWDLILSSFGLWQLDDRISVLRAWRDALTEGGRVAVLEWGPPEPGGPFELVGQALETIAPELGAIQRTHVLASRESMGEMLSAAGLQMVRHAVVRNLMDFGSAEGFLQAMCLGGSFVRFADVLGRDRTQRVGEAFYELVDPPSARTPLSFSPAASIAIAERQ